MFQKQRDELVLRKQAELNIIQKKAKVKKKFDGYDEACGFLGEEPCGFF
jgi:hypothetical protein